MSAGSAAFGHTAAPHPHLALSTKSIGNGALWLAAFLSGFVIREPAPYELYMAGLLVIWLACGLKLRREFGPLIICMMLYSAGGIASVPLAREFDVAVMYMAVSVFLAITSIFYAAILADDPRRYKTIENGLLASSVFVAFIGVAGYFHLFPGADYFTLYDRARGTFQDPNVFGPFLALPSMLLIQRLFFGRLKDNILTLLMLAVLLLGIFLSFSRGAWGVLVAAALVVYLLALITERGPVKRLRLLILGALGVLAVLALIATVLSIDSVADMFQQRAKLEQPYDAARLGRFARYAFGFQMVMEHPLGLGPLEFNKYFPEDEHNVYLKGFTTYGWLGGTVYIVMVFWTLAALFPLLFKRRPWTPFLHCVFAVLLSHVILSAIIDTDHWRHVYMLYGIAWGLIAADKLERKQTTKTNPKANPKTLGTISAWYQTSALRSSPESDR